MSELEGQIVEYVFENSTKFAVVTRANKDRLGVVDEFGRNGKLRADQVLWTHGSCSPNQFAGRVKKIEQVIIDLQQDIDTELLWETLIEEYDEKTRIEISDVTLDYFGNSDSSHSSAMLREMFNDFIHFRRKGVFVFVRTHDAVETRKQEIIARRKKADLIAGQVAYIKQVLGNDEAEPVPQEMTDLVRRVEMFVQNKEVGSLESILRSANSNSDLQEVAFRFLQNLGRISKDADPWVIKAGFTDTFNKKVASFVESCPPFSMDDPSISSRQDFRDLMTFSIDDVETEEIDDAISLETTDEGTQIWIHIADMAHYCEKDDLLDEVGYDRCSSIYLPTSVVSMVPKRIAHDLASLVQGEMRPSLSYGILVNDQGEILSSEIKRGVIEVNYRLNYDDVDQFLNNEEISIPDSETLQGALQKLAQLAPLFQDERARSGALIFKRREPKLMVKDEQIELKIIDTNSLSRTMISELMIIANNIAASFAAENNLPFIYRTQDKASKELDTELVADIRKCYDPIKTQSIIRFLPPARLTIDPAGHFGLGLSLYTQVTSPIRRYPDLVLQRQIVSLLEESEASYTSQELLQILSHAEEEQRKIRNLEQDVTRFYQLKYIHNQPSGTLFRVAILNDLADGFFVELENLNIRGKLKASKNSKLNGWVQATIQHIDARRGELVFKHHS